MTVAKSIRLLVQLCTFMSRSTPDSDCSRHVFARNFLAKWLGFLDVDGDRTRSDIQLFNTLVLSVRRQLAIMDFHRDVDAASDGNG